jgi:transcriptional repressor NrdR
LATSSEPIVALAFVGGKNMKCPYCNFLESKVVDSRPAEEGTSIRRRRECLECGKRFTTYENIETLPILVKKRDGSIQTFNSNKLLAGLVRACDKRSVDLKDLEAIVNSIETELSNSLDKETSSTKIGEMVLDHLQTIDQVAYIRFASVYRQFTDVLTFITEVQELMEKPKAPNPVTSVILD